MKNLKYFAVLLVCMALSFWAGTVLQKNGPGYEIVVMRDTIPGDSVPYMVVSYIPMWDTVIFHDTVFTEIDTAAILEDYFATRLYEDTITDDTSFLAILREEVSQNRINKRDYSHQNLRPLAIITTIEKVDPDATIEIGSYLGYGLKPCIGFEAMYRPPGGKFSFMGSLGIDGGRIGVNYRIKRWQK